jgi:hypothetical protein
VRCNFLRMSVGSNGNCWRFFEQDNHSNCRPLPKQLRPKIPVVSSALIILYACMICPLSTDSQLSCFFQPNIFGLDILATLFIRSNGYFCGKLLTAFLYSLSLTLFCKLRGSFLDLFGLTLLASYIPHSLISSPWYCSVSHFSRFLICAP